MNEELTTIEIDAEQGVDGKADSSQLPSTNSSDQEPFVTKKNTEPKPKPPKAADMANASPPIDELNGFWERQAKRMARNPCWHLNVCLVVAVMLSAIAMIVGEFSVSAESGGWQSRGTLIADRQTQLMLVDYNQWGLFYGGEAAWDELLNNVQPGWEDDDDGEVEEGSERRRGRSLTKEIPAISLGAYSTAETFLDYLRPQADRIELGLEQQQRRRQVPFQMTPQLHRQLQVNFEGCDLGWYTAWNFWEDPRLWPIWKITSTSTTSTSTTAFNPEIIHDICIAEENTQRHLQEKGLCLGCNGQLAGSDNPNCLPPFSLVLYARLVVENGFALSCVDLSTAWAPFQAETEEQWKTCVQDIKAKSDPNDEALPESCPFGFLPTLVEESFDTTMTSMYTSSIFATRWEDIDELYEEVEQLDRGSNLVNGAYDTQVS
jgi:hypothetical protein